MNFKIDFQNFNIDFQMTLGKLEILGVVGLLMMIWLLMLKLRKKKP